ncbi:MAG: type IX secretion system protein PorQ [Flavobacteriales bacterium]|nr:type IX secretion system protein PorQ [Flavobacteriales bacterium]
MNRPILLLCLSLFGIPAVRAQLGGQEVFRVLEIPSSARLAALGGTHIALMDDDLNLGIFNPALLNSTMTKQVALSYLPYFDGVKMGFGSYAHHFDSIRTTFSGTVQFVDYGTFTRTEGDGTEIGTFRAGEYVFQIGASRALDSLFSVGANVKFITSSLDTYNATGWAADLGAVYAKKSLGLTVAALVKNIGFVSSSYTEAKEKLPFEVQLGVTYKFRHAPFRLGLNLENLQQWDLTYDDPAQQVSIDPATGDEIVQKVSFGTKTLLHLVPNVEILLGRYFHVRAGFDFRRRRELKGGCQGGISGLCFGAGVRVSKFHISYGFAQYHLAGISNTVTLATRFNDFRRPPPGQEKPRKAKRAKKAEEVPIAPEG